MGRPACPAQRRPPGEKEAAVVVSKEVKRLREYEQALLRAYQALLKALLEVGRRGAGRGGAGRGGAGRGGARAPHGRWAWSAHQVADGWSAWVCIWAEACVACLARLAALGSQRTAQRVESK